jgi:hypothetical protein
MRKMLQSISLKESFMAQRVQLKLPGNREKRKMRRGGGGGKG